MIEIIQAFSIGSTAYDAIKSNPRGTISNTTSRGAFVDTNNGEIFFLSLETYRNPLCINLNAGSSMLANAREGSVIEFEKEKLVCTDGNWMIPIKSEIVWLPAEPILPPSEIAEQRQRIAQVAKELQNKQIGSFRKVLDRLINSAFIRLQKEQELSELESRVINLGDAIKRGTLEEIVEILPAVMGMGTGLTPSGDDFIIGFLLPLNRWKHPCLSRGDIATLNRAMVTLAPDRTNRISARLIECASNGVSDERLMATTDFIQNGQHHPEKIVKNLLSWGHASGADAFAGMAVLALL